MGADCVERAGSQGNREAWLLVGEKTGCPSLLIRGAPGVGAKREMPAVLLPGKRIPWWGQTEGEVVKLQTPHLTPANKPTLASENSKGVFQHTSEPGLPRSHSQ